LCILIIVQVTKAKEGHLTEVKIIKFNELGKKKKLVPQEPAGVITATLLIH